MSYSPEDSAWDDAYESMSRELYPDHKKQAIAEFTRERLCSYYQTHPEVLAPAARMFNESKVLLAKGHSAAALIFAASATELFLKAVLLRPVVYGLVHSEVLAELVVDAALSQTGFKRYVKLLEKLFLELAGIEIKTLIRKPDSKPLLEEAFDLHDLRNAVAHRGEKITQNQAEDAVDIATNIFIQVVAEVLTNLGITVKKGGIVVND